MTARHLTAAQAGTYSVKPRPRCACRPGCLAPVFSTDETVTTPDGLALAAHVDVVAHVPTVEQVPCEVSEQVS